MRGILTTITTLFLFAGCALAEGIPLWDHNGSGMGIRVDESNVEIVYLRPRRELYQYGITVDTPLFRGQTVTVGETDYYRGTAYIFDPVCGPVPYAVEGKGNDDFIELYGPTPVYDVRCQVVGEDPNSKNAWLRFKRVGFME